MKIVATTSLPAVDRPNADRWNAARSRQLPQVPLYSPLAQISLKRVHPEMKTSLIKEGNFVIVPIRFVSFCLFYFLDGKVMVK